MLYFCRVKPPFITETFLRQFIRQALQEDVGEGDHSTLSCIGENTPARARLIVKEDAVLAGLPLAETIFKEYDPSLNITFNFQDGDAVRKGDVGFVVEGPARSLLTTERLVLNCLQRMSGIATKTRKFVKLIEGSKAQLLDTRKTTPNFRYLEKWAVLIGGGKNHRMGLYDMVMLKDNHIDLAGGIEEAIIRTKDYLRIHKKALSIEIETRTVDEVSEVVRVGGVDKVLLDNMTLDELAESVKLIGGRLKTEASGNINERTIRDVAATGVDFISVGELTHTVHSIDMSLKVG